MKLEDIKKRSLQEDSKDELAKQIKRIKKKVKNLTSGQDIFVPEHLTIELEIALDCLRIPCYVLHDGCISIAKTYTQLYDHEKRR